MYDFPTQIQAVINVIAGFLIMKNWWEKNLRVSIFCCFPLMIWRWGHGVATILWQLINPPKDLDLCSSYPVFDFKRSWQQMTVSKIQLQGFHLFLPADFLWWFSSLGTKCCIEIELWGFGAEERGSERERGFWEGSSERGDGGRERELELERVLKEERVLTKKSREKWWEREWEWFLTRTLRNDPEIRWNNEITSISKMQWIWPIALSLLHV